MLSTENVRCETEQRGRNLLRSGVFRCNFCFFALRSTPRSTIIKIFLGEIIYLLAVTNLNANGKLITVIATEKFVVEEIHCIFHGTRVKVSGNI